MHIYQYSIVTTNALVVVRQANISPEEAG